MPLAQGAVIRVVSDEYLDRPTGVGAGLGTALRRIASLIGYVLLELGVAVLPLVLAGGLAMAAVGSRAPACWWWSCSPGLFLSSLS